jgi:hypothetical protein
MRPKKIVWQPVGLGAPKRKRREPSAASHGLQANSCSIHAETRGKMSRLPTFYGRLGQVRQAASAKTLLTALILTQDDSFAISLFIIMLNDLINTLSGKKVT